MVFSSAHLYPDPPNWNQQGGSTDITVDESVPHQQVSTGGTTCRPAPTAERARLAKIPQPEPALKCPRCDSPNTKFCYFNNYSLTQPRHFCKTCRRYWTRGGALRSVPVGGGCRRNKRGNKPSSSKTAASSTSSLVPPSAPPQFLAPWNHVPDYGIQQPIDTSTLESMGLEQWRIQQIQHFPFLAELCVPTGTMVPGLYPLEGEHGKMIKMEESSTAANMPRQLFNMGRNDGQIWPVSGGGEDHYSTGNLL